MFTKNSHPHLFLSQHILHLMTDDRFNAFGGAFDYLMQTGYLFGGWQLGRSALVAMRKLEAGETSDFYRRKVATAHFYGARILPRCRAHAGAVLDASSCLSAFELAWL